MCVKKGMTHHHSMHVGNNKKKTHDPPPDYVSMTHHQHDVEHRPAAPHVGDLAVVPPRLRRFPCGAQSSFLKI